jgi:type II restriction/modification system DNA methylase subunit YeeA
MDTAKLKNFAQNARRQLLEQVRTRLEIILNTDSVELRERAQNINKLKEDITKTSKEAVIDRIAYTWFNRFCALRFMDVNRYTPLGIVSPAPGFTQPEILAEAKQGHIDDVFLDHVNGNQVGDLLAGRFPSKDPQNEAYRLLLVAVCKYYHEQMPFLFATEGYSDLLLPGDLLSEGSILYAVCEALTEEDCQDVEVIGWLYQYYISEKKDEVFADLKRNKKITPENIPAATQLFTPHWIVRYLVENSLGRLWMLNHPKSHLIEQMDYYIKPEDESGGTSDEADHLRINSPEELKICDPACGSGHMLVYAFDLLYTIYEEEGYDPIEIPGLILEKNLYGIEIDKRAGELAAFALIMKARSKYRGFLRHPVQPNICVLENVHFKEGEIKSYIDEVGLDLFTANLIQTLSKFEEADNFGSLIRPALTDVESTLMILEGKDIASNLYLSDIHPKVLKVLKQADYLSPKYHVVIANPPYMGSKGMNPRLRTFAQENYPNSKSDLFAMFIERGFDLVVIKGYNAMVTMQSWMFLSSYEKLRERLLDQVTIDCMVHMANMVMGIAFGTAATVWNKISKPEFKGHFSFVYYEDLTKDNKPKEFPVRNERLCKAATSDFKKIPGSPIAYWLSDKFVSCFVENALVGEMLELKAGISTGDNAIFERCWHEVALDNCSLHTSTCDETETNNLTWYPCHSGGEYRKWFGNHSVFVNWRDNGQKIRHFGLNEGRLKSAVRNEAFQFRSGITWSKISSGKFAARWRPSGFMFDDTGRCGFSNDFDKVRLILGLFCSKLSDEFLRILCPTLSFTSGELAKIPFVDVNSNELCKSIEILINLSKSDWDSYETSWDFTDLPLLRSDYRRATLQETYKALRAYWWDMTLEMQRLEEENNRIFIGAYGLEEELTPDVPLEEITLTCNPNYRYGGNRTEDELEALLLADTMKEFISYAVGCMFGRYSLDKPGLILANQGQTIEDYLQQVPNPTFSADSDNVIPIMDDDWFMDDIAERFRRFLRVTFGDEEYEENLRFIEEALGKDIRKYFLKDFYNDHVKRYKKRPIYWLFSSPKGSFNALIYMHRYNPDTVGLVLNNYLREFRAKLASRQEHLEQASISASASQSEKTRALKEIEKLKKTIRELDDYERDILYPLATRRVVIDLDDGVKVNYRKFGKALKKIPGLEARQD